jgi:uncharacterized protein
MVQLAQLGEFLEKLLTPADFGGRTRLLVLQGTPFCNIACDYCYLPGRDDRRRMDYGVLERAVRWLYRNGLAADDLTLVWHAGEPLVLPPSWYLEAFARASLAAPRGAHLRHAFQTNGILVNDDWCDLFLAHNVSVGLSLDGPAILHDARRKTRSGSGTHAAVMRGIEVLRRRAVPFHIIAVVTAATLNMPDAFVDFFLANDFSHVGINIEEIEGENGISSLADPGIEDRFRQFLEKVIDRANASGRLWIREFWNTCEAIMHPGFEAGNDENTPFAIVSISFDGRIATFSPELLGQTNSTFGDFIVGHVDRTELADILVNPCFQACCRSISQGIETCRTSCSYYPLCGGGAPANKMGEHGSFAVSETLFCRLVKQQVAEVVLARLDLALERHRNQLAHSVPW